MHKRLIAAVVAVLLVAPLAAWAVDATAWNVDTAHSEVGFKVRHFFTPVTGKFTDYDVQLNFDPDNLAESKVMAEIRVASIDTGNERRDGHLRTGDFFDAEQFGTITFESSSIREAGDNQYVATGNLTIKDTTREVELPVTLLGIKEMPEGMQERFGSKIASFQANLTIDRNDYGVGTGSWAETTVVGAEVEIELLVEANVR